MLDVVELSEFSAVVWRCVVLELASGLAAEVASVNEEEDLFSVGEFDEAIDEANGGVCFAASRSHLDEGTWPGFGEGLLQVGDGFNLTIP